MQGDNVLEVRGLSVDYGGAAGGAVHAVADVSFVLRRGEILGLAGESGSGKSTLAYAIARLLQPPARVTAGGVTYIPRPTKAPEEGMTVEGVDIAGSEPVNVLTLSEAQLRTFRWRTLSFVFQSAMNALNPVLDIYTQIDDVLRAHLPSMPRPARQSRAKELLQLVGIAADRIHSYPHELSGGMRQRAVIAIALALNPEIVILDEPTTALDVVVQREILAELLALRDRLGFSVIFITHDLSLLLELADRVAIMYAGRMVELGSRADIYVHPRHPYTAGLLHSFPSLQGERRELTGIPGTPPDLRTVPPGCAFHPRCAYAFDACQTVVPELRRVEGDAGIQRVACHLYDPALNTGSVPQALVTAGYAGRHTPDERSTPWEGGGAGE